MAGKISVPTQIVRMNIFERGNGSYNAISAIYGNTSVIFDVSR